MSCEIWQNELDRYLDGELPEEQQRSLRQHLDSCATCAREALGRVQLKRAVARVGRPYQPSAEFRARIARQVSPKKRWSWGLWAPMAAAAALLLIAFTATFFYAQRVHRRQIIAEVVDLHVSNLAGANPVDVVSSDKHTVKPWFQGKLPFTFDLPDVAGTPFELLGGKMTYVNQEPAALLVYGVRKHKVSVIVSLDRAGLEELGSSATTVNAFHLETWSQGGLRYMVISDTAAGDVHVLAEMFRRS